MSVRFNPITLVGQGMSYKSLLVSHLLIIYPPSLMQGVRQWMGSQPSSRRKASHVTIHDPGTKLTRHESEQVDSQSTEYIATESMNPTVPEDELQEYEGYVSY